MKARHLMVGLWCILLASAAVPQRAPRPERAGTWVDAELAQIATDIYLLQKINDCRLSTQQIRKVIPVLERMLNDAKRLRQDVRGKLLAERKRLILGQSPATPPDAVRRMIREEAERLRVRTQQAMESTSAFLSSDQVQKLRGVLQGRPEGFFQRALQPPPWHRGPGQEQQRTTPRPPQGPSILALQRVVELLKEKLAALGG